MNYLIIHLAENLLLRVIYLRDLHKNPSKSAGIEKVIADNEEIILVEDHKEIEKRKSFKALKSHLDDPKKNELILAKGLSALKKYF